MSMELLDEIDHELKIVNISYLHDVLWELLQDFVDVYLDTQTEGVIACCWLKCLEGAQSNYAKGFLLIDVNHESSE